MDLVCDALSLSALQLHATSTLWGLAQEKQCRSKIADRAPVILQLVQMLSDAMGETQKLAVATLVTLGQEEGARTKMVDVISGIDAAGTLQMLKIVKDSWLRTQAEELMMLLCSTTDASATGKAPAFQQAATSPRINQQRLCNNPAPLIDIAHH